MLALSRALIPKPKMLLLDEPSLGLSPGLISTAFDRISHINRHTGVTVLIVEQKVRDVLKLSHRVYGVKLGKIVLDGAASEAVKDDELKSIFL